ncbi:hypothetical protein IV102_11365 [bacterium]|nr:hypothetical protein [bacterium]
MASEVKFNPSSFPIPGLAGRQRHQGVTPQEQPMANQTDGFQSSGPAAQPNPKAAITAQAITLPCTPEQLGTAAFQQTIVTLAAFGFQVTLAIQSAGGPQPTPTPPSQAGCKDEVAQLRQELCNMERQIDDIAEAVKKPLPPHPYFVGSGEVCGG